MSRFIDKHAELRKGLNLFQAVEPSIELVGMTQMFDKAITGFDATTGAISTGNIIHPQGMPGYVARMSHQSEGTKEDDVRLTKKLLTFTPPHGTPYEFMQWVFKVTGVTKSCLTQFDRNRIGIGFVQMSGRYMDSSNRGYVYNAYDYMSAEDAKAALEYDASHYMMATAKYNFSREHKQTKQDSRKNLPLAMATGTYVHMNSRSLKTFFNERLRPAAEWEIRRTALSMFDIVYGVAPSHFEFEKTLVDAEV